MFHNTRQKLGILESLEFICRIRWKLISHERAVATWKWESVKGTINQYTDKKDIKTENRIRSYYKPMSNHSETFLSCCFLSRLSWFALFWNDIIVFFSMVVLIPKFAWSLCGDTGPFPCLAPGCLASLFLSLQHRCRLKKSIMWLCYHLLDWLGTRTCDK